MGKNSQYGVILDAGSSGTRLYVYKWKNPANAGKDASAAALRALPELKLESSKKIHPGVATFADDVASVGPDHLDSLIDIALHEVPSDKISDTPIFLMATAGVRFLPKDRQVALLQGVCTYLQANTDFYLPDCDTHIQVIPGETEGLYGWIAANYLLGGFDHPEQHDHGKGHHTYGFLDMGGASAQIAFAPNSTEADKHAEDLKMVRLRHLNGSPVEYRVFTATWLGFGANKARDRYIEGLVEVYGDSASELPDPCMPTGLRTTIDGEPVAGKTSTGSQVLIGTGRFGECLRKTYPLLGKDAPCEDDPCLLDGRHVPAIDFDVNHFVGVSEYWHTTHGVFGGKHKAYDLATYQNRVMDFCSRDWSDIESDLDKRKKTPGEEAAEAMEACFKASWLINVLYDGIGIPRVGLEGVESGAGINATKEALDKAKEQGFVDPFQPVDEIDGIELSWTLGKMVLYAAGQIPPAGSPRPVGFGSNIGAGTPPDFEMAGSVPLLPTPDDDDDFDIINKPSKPASSLVFLIVLLVFVGYLLRKPERRRRLLSLVRRRRKSGNGRKPGRGMSLASKLFGRSPTSYDRIMEEGEASEFELGDVDSEETEHSDSSDGSRGGSSLGSLASLGSLSLPTSKPSAHRLGEMRPPSAMDRNGLVVRTESRERLAPLQMLNAGRRSRAGSPTRQKTPLMNPLQED